MCCTTIDIHSAQYKRCGARPAVRLIALAACILFITASLLSAAFILTHANHEHDHNGADGSCATCTNMMAAGNLLKQLSTPLAGSALGLGSLLAVLSALEHISCHISFYTLVSLKVRLNN
jgi:hypothetical protein